MKTYENLPDFLEQGIRFECTQCGTCCTGAPGLVFVSSEETEQIAHFLGMPREDFVNSCLRSTPRGHSIRERTNWDCWFYSDSSCTIYSVRPTQCRTYPFWYENLRSKANWKSACSECPGIGRGRLYDREEVIATMERNRAHKPGSSPSSRKNA